MKIFIVSADLMARYGHEAEVLAASFCNPRQTRKAAQVGAHVATLSFAVIKELLTHELTMEGMQSFTDDVVPEYAELLAN